MLRFLYISCDILAAVFAVISPVAIFHWLMRITLSDSALLAPYMAPVNGFFDPLNAVVDMVFHAPPLSYNGQLIPTTQGVLACLLTASFFLLNFLSEYLKTTEQRFDVDRQAQIQRQRLQQLKRQQSQSNQKVVSNRRYLVNVSYDFALCPTGGDCMEQGLARLGGNALERLPDYMTVEFGSLDLSIEYCMTASQAIMGYYATLRPVDPQPPFRIGIHAIDANLPVSDASSETRKLVGFAAPNQVVFTQSVRDVLEANGQSMAYHFQSIGMYGLSGGSQELFKLFNDKPRHTF